MTRGSLSLSLRKPHHTRPPIFYAAHPRRDTLTVTLSPPPTSTASLSITGLAAALRRVPVHVYLQYILARLFHRLWCGRLPPRAWQPNSQLYTYMYQFLIIYPMSIVDFFFRLFFEYLSFSWKKKKLSNFWVKNKSVEKRYTSLLAKLHREFRCRERKSYHQRADGRVGM